MPPEDEVIQRLLAVADTNRIEPSPQFMERMLALTPDSASTPTASVPSTVATRWTRRSVLTASLLAAVLLGVSGLLLWHPAQTWAQVAEAVAGKSWIRMRAADPKGHTREVWLSLPRDMAALKSPLLVRHDNYRKGERFEFDPATKKLLRLPLDGQGSYGSLTTFFRAIFRGDARLGERLAEDQIVSQTQRTVTESGKPWLEHDLTIQRGDKTAVCTVRVDPKQRLPVWMRIKAEGQQLQYDFDYPANGPMTIFELNVPRDLAVDDRMPPADVAKIQRSLESCQKDLDNYMAIVMRANRSRGGIQSPDRIVWRKGDRWRVELVQPKAPPKDARPVDGDVAAWWRTQIRPEDSLPVLVCDGRKVYRPDYSKGATPTWKTERVLQPGEGRGVARTFGDAGEYLLEFAAYPALVSSAMSTIALDPKGTGGPDKSTLLELNFTGGDDRVYRKTRYWLDPERQFVVLKSELSGCAAVDRDPQAPLGQKVNSHEYGEFRQSPRGIWYPTEVIWKNALTPVSSDKTKPPAEPQDLVRNYFMDFEAELPDELFTPTLRSRMPGDAR